MLYCSTYCTTNLTASRNNALRGLSVFTPFDVQTKESSCSPQLLSPQHQLYLCLLLLRSLSLWHTSISKTKQQISAWLRQTPICANKCFIKSALLPRKESTMLSPLAKLGIVIANMLIVIITYYFLNNKVKEKTLMYVIATEMLAIYLGLFVFIN